MIAAEETTITATETTTLAEETMAEPETSTAAPGTRPAATRQKKGWICAVSEPETAQIHPFFWRTARPGQKVVQLVQFLMHLVQFQIAKLHQMHHFFVPDGRRNHGRA